MVFGRGLFDNNTIYYLLSKISNFVGIFESERVREQEINNCLKLGRIFVSLHRRSNRRIASYATADTPMKTDKMPSNIG